MVHIYRHGPRCSTLMQEDGRVRGGGRRAPVESYLDGIKVSRGLNGHAYILQVKGHRDNTTAVRGERSEFTRQGLAVLPEKKLRPKWLRIIKRIANTASTVTHTGHAGWTSFDFLYKPFHPWVLKPMGVDIGSVVQAMSDITFNRKPTNNTREKQRYLLQRKKPIGKCSYRLSQ